MRYVYVIAALALAGVAMATVYEIILRDTALKSCAAECDGRLFRVERSSSHYPYHCLCMNDEGRYAPVDALEKNQ